jgi:hypothetical protein
VRFVCDHHFGTTTGSRDICEVPRFIFFVALSGDLLVFCLVFLDFSMDPYTNALNCLRNLNLGPSARAFDDIDLTFLPNTWSGAHLTHSDQPWPFVFMVRELLSSDPVGC